MSDPRDDGFFSRWARRKADARRSVTTAEPSAPPAQGASVVPPAPAVTAPVPAPQPAAAAPEAPPPPTMEDVARLTRGSDFSPFVRAGVDEGVKRAALKKLFADPHFNVMDGLDVYIDDYGKPDPLPASMLRKMAQSKALGLFTDEPAPVVPATAAAPDAGASSAVAPTASPDTALPIPAPAPEAVAEAPADEDADLRLQPLDAAGREGDPRDAGEDAGREC